MRKCIWTWSKEGGVRRTISGYFHGFFQVAENESCAYPVAVVEDPNGRIKYFDPEAKELRLCDEANKEEYPFTCENRACRRMIRKQDICLTVNGIVFCSEECYQKYLDGSQILI